MRNYERMKKKWERRVKLEKAGDCFDAEQLTSGKFCVHLVDCGGESMASVSEIEITGYFDSGFDFLGYLRFSEIPRILDFDTNTNKEPFPAVADSYLEKYETDQREQIDRLLGQIDKCLIAGAVSNEELDIVLDSFNATFLSTNPEIQLLAWGTVAETLNSPYFKEADEDQEVPPELQKLLDTSKFDEDNIGHLALAREYFESRFSA
jgi:hypothetical protein